MNYTNEVYITIDGEEQTMKMTNLALHRSVKDLGLPGMVPLLAGIEDLDLNTLFTLLKHGTKSKKSVEKLMESDVSLTALANAVGEALVAALGSNDKSDSDQ